MDEKARETALVPAQGDLQVALCGAVSLWASATTSESERRADLLRDKEHIVRAGMTALDVTHAHAQVRGTQLAAGGMRERYREKIARITMDSMVQFVGLLDARGTVLEINQVALDAVDVTLPKVEGRPFWTTFWWQVSGIYTALWTSADESRASLPPVLNQC